MNGSSLLIVENFRPWPRLAQAHFKFLLGATFTKCRVIPPKTADGELQSIFVRLSVLREVKLIRRALQLWPRKDLGNPALGTVRTVALPASLLPRSVTSAGNTVVFRSHSTHRRESPPTRQEAVPRRWQLVAPTATRQEDPHRGWQLVAPETGPRSGRQHGG